MMPALYKDLLVAWYKLDVKSKFVIISKADVLRQPLFCNNIINSDLFNIHMVKAGLTRISHVWDVTSQCFLSYAALQEKAVDVSEMFYQRLMSAIPGGWQHVLKARNEGQLSKLTFTLQNGHTKRVHNKWDTKFIYGCFQKDIQPPVSLNKWRNIFNMQLKPQQVYVSYSDKLSDNYIKDIHWKYLHLALPTKDFLLKCKLVDDNKCPSCGEIGTLEFSHAVR